MAEWKERKTIRSWAIVKPDGEILLDSEFKNEADAWQIVLGWPGDGEIEEAKKNGYRAVLATVII
jgi:hypothetical protein